MLRQPKTGFYSRESTRENIQKRLFQLKKNLDAMAFIHSVHFHTVLNILLFSELSVDVLKICSYESTVDICLPRLSRTGDS